ncbi:pyridoxamine 5'-phosphate oxidase family protein [Roseobacter sp. GAI101]|uniref:pyridoxamine 5'-phosphate oxidase family protein n=1 Tax=Roseobacter sp. (strain GAI101) TaxID=391589 RepID=UPI0001871D2A|nr:pyridoxamine 5'-phosphate oxidase family protein [Roseobacter sp. GAI101]EEB86028.1 pyridoxamine 5'-phosphate oxidase-related, FMN-binding [Roseobacter sp. GAI101]
MSDAGDLRAFLAEAWQHLERGVADSRSPARFPTFVTVSPEGKPQARTVALRAASRHDGVLEVHTDIATPKVTALGQNPHAALHVWLPDADLQIRLVATVEVLTGPTVAAQWAKVPVASRVSYGTEPVPGCPIPDVYAYEKPANRTRFAVLRCSVEEMDLVHLGSRHRRAVFGAGDAWAGTWVAP